ncbi:uncharacterized protein LACBIDRAFT_333024 [Laccaria bicolor S238N-H82]|uniref:Predicted protein n=1 Tax=Laccaria bicolor (strain S238N-H82 / ATCC MYA-4686) TaxID=486041 RepID=B0DUL4_LACBS|nr:uncharacterized protein LACBIDRAFT_333024 [Laccaria bicolor S238N-H82]EDR01822.1 predicted protein [Laccaria bicolor S238N-H82]|eukprot:XP_001887635.1 predicted protein [Laccaria bicolor S238N-H82]
MPLLPHFVWSHFSQDLMPRAKEGPMKAGVNERHTLILVPSVFPAEHMPATPPSTRHPSNRHPSNRHPSNIYDDPNPDGFQPSIWPTQHFNAFDDGSPFAQRSDEKEEKEEEEEEEEEQEEEEQEEEEDKGWDDNEENFAYGGDDEDDGEDKAEDGMVHLNGV